MKTTIIALFLVANLHAISYEALLEKALQNNASLQIDKTQSQKVKLEGGIERRLQNPTIAFELSDFASQRIFRDNALGARVGVSQPLLLPSVKEDKKRLTQTQVALQEQNFLLNKLAFIYQFNLHYLALKKAHQQQKLQEEAVEISKKIRDVVEGRFRAGTVAKSELLQVEIELKEVLTQAKQLALESLAKKHELLLFANLSLNHSVDTQHHFNETTVSLQHPMVGLIEKKEAVAQSKLEVASHTIQTIELFSEIEAEPDQDIFRVGVAVPLPIFNKNREEKQLAKIEIQNQKLALFSTQKALRLELAQLKEELGVQRALKTNYEALVEEEKALLEMYQKGYRMAKVNLLKLSSVKKELLRTKENLLATAFNIEKNIIKINYLQGAYNE